MAGLDRFGIGDALRQRSAQIQSVALSHADGRHLIDTINIAESDSYLPRRGVLQELLFNRLGPDAVRLGKRAMSATQDEGVVSVAFANGETSQAEL